MFYVRLLPGAFISDVVQPGLPFAHLNILISAEFEFALNFFFYGPAFEISITVIIFEFN